jgi:hypothetical protein
LVYPQTYRSESPEIASRGMGRAVGMLGRKLDELVLRSINFSLVAFKDIYSLFLRASDVSLDKPGE